MDYNFCRVYIGVPLFWGNYQIKHAYIGLSRVGLWEISTKTMSNHGAGLGSC